MSAAETVPLAVDEAGEGPAVLFLHGLLGRGRNWASLARELARGRRVLLVDLRNHGRSPHHPVTTYPAMAGDVAALIEARGFGRVALVGHSMGGKVAMVLACTRPDRVERLVVVDVAPVDYGPSAEFASYLRAMAAIDPARFERRAEVERALAGAVPDARIRAFLASNLELRDGRLAWAPNLSALLAGLPAITGFPPDLPPAPPDLLVSVIAGGRSGYVRPDHRAAFLRLFAAPEFVTVPEAGHWVHADAPQRVVALLDALLPRARDG